MASARELKKIRFDLTHATNRSELPDELVGETLWAEPIGGGARWRLRNAPAYVLGYAEGDIVECVHNDMTGWDEVTRLVVDSGNGTVRVFFVDARSDEAKEIIAELKSVGCTYEVASQHLVVFVVPPTLAVPFTQLENYLNAARGTVVDGWEIGKHMSAHGDDSVQ